MVGYALPHVCLPFFFGLHPGQSFDRVDPVTGSGGAALPGVTKVVAGGIGGGVRSGVGDGARDGGGEEAIKSVNGRRNRT